MAKILNRLYARFGLYHLDGALQAPSQLDVGSPVQPVHDVSAMVDAEASRLALASGGSGGTDRNGQFEWALEIVNAIAAVAQTSFTLTTANLRALGYTIDLSRFDLELIQVAATATATGCTFHLFVSHPTVAGNAQAVATDYRLLATFKGTPDLLDGFGGIYQYPVLAGSRAPLPLRCPQGTVIRMHLLSTGAATVDSFFLFRIVPK